MTEPVRFVKIRVCKNCGTWLEPGCKEELCPECLKKKEEEQQE